MKKFYKIFLFLIALILLSTFNPKEFDFVLKDNTSIFKIKNITIKNNFLIEERKIKEKLNKIYNKNIFLIKGADIEEPLKKLNFFKKIEVQKKYPNTIIIKIFETEPVAILFKNKKKYLLDSSSNLISLQNDIKINDLPSVFGEKAENNFIRFFNQLKKYNFPHDQVKKFYYFQIGRWDLEFANKKIIKLPNDNIENAINKSIELLGRKDFKNYNVIDLRVDGKIIVE